MWCDKDKWEDWKGGGRGGGEMGKEGADITAVHDTTGARAVLH